MRVRIRGKYYTVRFVNRLPERRKRHKDDVALCDPPHLPRKTIYILKGQEEQAELDSLIHEMLHAGFWDIEEAAVDALATDMAAILFSLGYRKTA